jgi:hypothetical protein
MSTPKQIAASRANGAKSKGPVTPQGKRNSSRNATRHGLLAETVVLEAEHTGRFLALLHELEEEHQPCTLTETMLVETIAVARWRQDRIWGMQKVAFDSDVDSTEAAPESPALRAVLALRSSPENIRTHELLLRYEIAFDRQISRALLRLHQLQDRRLRVAEEPAPHDSQPVEESIATHSAPGASPTSAKSAASPSNPQGQATALRDPKETARVERTQQPLETVIPPLPARRQKQVQSAHRKPAA